MRNLLTSFMDQRETIGNLLAPFITGQPQQFAKQPNPNMLLQGAEAAQQPAPPLSASTEVLQKQVAEVPRAVDPMPTNSTSQAMPPQPPQSKSGGFFDGLSKFGESDFGQRLNDMMLGWSMGGTMQDSLSKGGQMIAAGNQDRKAKKEQFNTAEWLKSKGMDEEEAKYVAGNSHALNAYLIALRKGVDPMQALQQRKMELEINKLENPQLSPSDQLAREKFEWEKSNGDGSTEYGLNPIWGQDDQGKPVLGVIGKNGSFKQVDTGGFDISSGTEQIDLGDSFAIKDKRSGQIIGSVPKNLANAEREKVLGKASGERETSAEGDFTTAQNALDLIDNIRNDPYRERGTGASAVLNNVWGTGGYDFSQKVEQAKSGAFLTAIQQMKGLGALSNNEGAAATAAVTRMNTAMSEQGFLDALADYEKIVKQGMERARKNLPSGSGASSASNTVDFSDYFKQ